MRALSQGGVVVFGSCLLVVGCTSAVRDVPVTPLAGQSDEQRSTDAEECDASARKEARYRPIRPAGDSVVRGTADRPAHEVGRTDSGVGGTLRGDGGFVGGTLGFAFGGPDRDLYVRLYADCMARRGYQPVKRR